MWWLDAHTTPDTHCVSVLLPTTDESSESLELSPAPTASLPITPTQPSRARKTLYRSANARIAVPYRPRKSADQESSDELASSVLASTKAEHARQLANLQQAAEAKLKKAEQTFAADMRRLRLTIANLEGWQQQRDADFRQKLRSSHSAAQEAAERVERVLSQRDADLAELKAALSAERRKTVEREARARKLADNVAKYQALLDSQIRQAPHDQHVSEYELALLRQQLADTQQQKQAATDAHQERIAGQQADFARRLEQADSEQHETIRALLLVLAQREEELAKAESTLESEQRQRQRLESELCDKRMAIGKYLQAHRLWIEANHDQHIVEFKLAHAEQRLLKTANQTQAEMAAIGARQTQREANLERQLEQALAEQRSISRQLASVVTQRDQERAESAQLLENERRQAAERNNALHELRSRSAQQQSLLNSQILHAAHDQHVIDFKLTQANRLLQRESSQLQTVVASNEQRFQQLQHRESELVRDLEQARAQQLSLIAQHESKRSELEAVLATERKRAAERESAFQEMRSQSELQQSLLNSQITSAAHDQHVVEFQLAQANGRFEQESTQLQTVLALSKQRVQQLQHRESELVRDLEQARAQQRSLIAQHESKRSELEVVLETERKQAAERESAFQEVRSRSERQQAILDSQIIWAAHDQHVVEFKLAGANERLEQESTQLQTVIASSNQRVQQMQNREAELVRHLEQAQAHQRSLVAQHESKISELENSLETERELATERGRALGEMQSKLAQQQSLLNSQILHAAHEQHILEFQLAKSNHELVQNGTQLKTAIASSDQQVQQLQFRKEELSRQLEQSVAAQQQSAIQLANVVAQRDEKLSHLNAALAAEREQRSECENKLRQIEGELVEQRAIIEGQVMRVPHDQHVVEFRLARAERQLVENNAQLQTAIVSSSHQTQRLQQREAVLSRQLEQALAEQKQAAHQRELTVAQRDERLAELNAALAAERGRVAERQTAISQLEARLASRQDSSPAQMPAGEPDQHVWEFKVAKAEKHRVETLIASRNSIKVLEDQIELRESEVLKRLAESWSARRRTEIELAEAVSKHDQTVAALNSRLVTLQRLADERAATIVELEDSLLELKKSRVFDFQQAQNAAGRRTSTPRHSAWIQELEASVASLKLRLSESLAAETAQRNSLAHEQTARTEAEAKVQECFTAIERLKRQVTDLQARLHREAGGRRKAEGALKRAAELADANTIAHTTQIQIASEQRIERLTNELEATKHHLLGLRRQAQARIQSEKLKSQIA